MKGKTLFWITTSVVAILGGTIIYYQIKKRKK
jgi:hypothetical protein